MRKPGLRVVLSLVLFGALLRAQDLTQQVQPLLKQASDALGKGEQKAALESLTEALRLLDQHDPDRRRTRKEVRPKFEAAGQARQLLRLLERKCGVLPPKLVARVRRARTETLDRWFDQFVAARMLDEVFAED